MNTEPEVLENTKVVPVVELTLSKSDLVDMMVSEQRDLIEERLDSLDNQIKDLDAAADIAFTEHKNKLCSLLKEKHGTKIKAAEKFLGSKTEYTFDSSRYSYGNKEEYKYYLYDSKHKKIERTVHLPLFDLHNIVRAGVSSKSKTDGDDSSGHWQVSLHLFYKDMTSFPTVVKLQSINSQMCELYKKKYDAESELSAIDSAGQRAKAKMVRQILEGSTQGRKLLESVPKLSGSVSLLSTKK